MSEAAAWYAGIGWLLNGFAIVWFEHPLTAVACWLPWLLLAVDRLAARPRAAGVAWLALAVAAAILAGHPETVFKVLLFTGAWAVHRAWGAPRAAWAALLAGAVAGLLLAAVQVVPFAEYLRASEALARRAAAPGNTFFLPIETILTAIVPDFFGNPAHGDYLARVNRFGVAANYGEQQVYAGAVTLLLAPLGLVAGWRDARMRFFAASGLAALALMYGAPGLLTIVSHLPILRVSILSRFGVVAIACAIVLAARGVDALTAADVPAGAEPATAFDASRQEQATPLASVLTLSLLALLAVIAIASFAFSGVLASAGLRAVSWLGAAKAAAVLVAAAACCWLRLLRLVRPRRAGRGPLRHPRDRAQHDRARLPPDDGAARRVAGGARDREGGARTPASSASTAGARRCCRTPRWPTDCRTHAAGTACSRPATPACSTSATCGSRRIPVRHLANPVILDLLNVKYVFVPAGVTLEAPRFARRRRPIAAVREPPRAASRVPRRSLPASGTIARSKAISTARASTCAASSCSNVSSMPASVPRWRPAASTGTAVVRHYRDTMVEVETYAPGRRLPAARRRALSRLAGDGGRTARDDPPGRLRAPVGRARPGPARRAFRVPALDDPRRRVAVVRPGAHPGGQPHRLAPEGRVAWLIPRRCRSPSSSCPVSPVRRSIERPPTFWSGPRVSTPRCSWPTARAATRSAWHGRSRPRAGATCCSCRRRLSTPLSSRGCGGSVRRPASSSGRRSCPTPGAARVPPSGSRGECSRCRCGPTPRCSCSGVTHSPRARQTATPTRCPPGARDSSGCSRRRCT